MEDEGPDYKEAIRNPSVVPALLRRAIMHVIDDLQGDHLERFENAYKIAVWRLTEGCKPPRIERKTLHLTRAGVLATRKRATDSDTVQRLRAFAAFISKIRDDLDRRDKREKSVQ